MVLIDTSSWIETLRVRGNAAVRERVSALVVAGEAAWCHMIRLELWQGARGNEERETLESLEEVVELLEIDQRVWERSIALGRLARSRGLTVQTPDLIIVATAQHHGVPIDSCDGHFESLIKLNG